MTEENKQATVSDASPAKDVKVEGKKDSVEVLHSTNEQPDAGSDGKVEKDTKEPVKAPDDRKAEEPVKSKSKERAELRKAERERDKIRIAVLEEQLKQTNSKPAKEEQAEKQPKDFSKEPNIQDYTDVLEYQRDVAKYDRLQEKAEEQKVQSEKASEAKAQRFDEQAAEIEAVEPGFNQKVVDLVQRIQPSQDIIDLVMDSDMSAKLTQHFVKYPADLQQVNALQPQYAKAAMKQIENFIKQGGQPAEVKQETRQTQAKAPIAPTGNSANVERSIESYTNQELIDMPQAEYNRRFGTYKR